MSSISDVAVRTIIPIVLLMGTGFFSRRIGILKLGDERVFSAYIYYFALPALFFVNMVETDFGEETLRFMSAGVIPILGMLTLYIILYLILRFSKKILYLFILSTVFGSLAFFGIPFITFAFPTIAGEHLATLSAATISVVSVPISITVLELYKLDTSTVWMGFRQVTRRLSKNPLIISILSGIVLSLVGIEIPSPVSTSLHMLGGTTSTVAIFMLGVFLYGRKYTHIVEAFGLSLLRMVALPLVAFTVTMAFNLSGIERSVLVLMHGMPVAISMIVLSERYDFFRETISSLILISSLGAGAYLNLWLLLL